MTAPPCQHMAYWKRIAHWRKLMAAGRSITPDRRAELLKRPAIVSAHRTAQIGNKYVDRTVTRRNIAK